MPLVQHRNLRLNPRPPVRRAYRWAAAVALLLLSYHTGSAFAANRTFSANSLIIPMDVCYQPGSYPGRQPSYCVDSPGRQDDGVLKAYGLVYRLLQRGISVYVIINPAKTALADVDMQVSAPSGSPVALLNFSTGGTSEFFRSQTIYYRGAPFVIDAPDRDRVVSLLRTDPVIAGNFTSVDIHVAKQSFSAPVKVQLSSAPPKIAVLNLGNASDQVMVNYLSDAGLNTSTAGGIYPASSGEIYDRFNNASDFTSGGLRRGNYRILWSLHWSGSGDPNAPGVMQAIADHLDRGNGFMAACASIETHETSYFTNRNDISAQGVPPGNFQTTRGVWINGVNSFGNNAGEVWRLGDATSIFVQFGDYEFQSIGGSVHTWKPQTAVGSAYRPGVVRLFTSYQAGNPDRSDWDVMSFTFKDNDPRKGPIVYLGGHNYNGQISGTRLILNTLLYLGTQTSTPAAELARSSPITRSDGTTLQGTYVENTAAASAYPPVAGHFRQYRAGALTGADVAAFDTLTADWDAADRLPSAANRTVLTAIPANAGRYAQVSFTRANATQLAGPLGVASSNAGTIIDAIRAGRLGGVDHSTPAVIGPSTAAGSANRPTVAYFGALDGMLHAVLVSGGSAGTPPGTELWAFIPPSQIGRIAGYQAGVDGSPAVADAFISDANGTSSWRTLLAIPCGNFGGTVSVLDITDPLQPRFLWEGGSPADDVNYVMGSARGAAFGFVARQDRPTSVVFLATNNQGRAGNGFNLYALDAANGTILGRFSRSYTRRIPNTTTLVPNDIPGVPATADTSGNGSFDSLLFFGNLEGRVWQLDASFESTPPTVARYDVGVEGQPIANSVAVFRDRNTRHLAFIGVTGGADWVPQNTTPFAFAVDAQTAAAEGSGQGRILFQTPLGIGERTFAAPTVAGNDVYIFSSSGSVTGLIGSTSQEGGRVRRIALTSGDITATTQVTKGASEVGVTNDGKVVATSAAGISLIDNANRDATGLAIDDLPIQPLLIEAWLDLH